MSTRMKSDLADLPGLADDISRWCVSFQQRLDELPVAQVDDPRPPASALRETGLGTAAAFAAFVRDVAPGLSGAAGPRYLGFVTGGTTPAAMLADWLVSATDQNVSSPGDSISTAIELQAIEWLRDLFALPKEFFGVLTSGATAANVLGVVCGRQFAGLAQGRDIARDGLGDAAIDVFSATPHASSLKALALGGLGRNGFRRVACLPGSEAMDPVALESALDNSSTPGKIVVASAGTVTGTNFDDLHAISTLCRKYGAWLHVDGAFGLFSRLSEARRPWTNGLERADSITCDAHKWLNVPYDCGMFFTRRPDILKQTCSVAAPYLESAVTLPSLMDYGIENSRRFRALPLWMTLQAYGRDGVSDMVERNCAQARELAGWIADSERYELLTPCRLNVVVFRPNVADGAVSDCLRRINASGKVFMTPGQWNGRSAIRAAFSNWRTSSADVRSVCKVLAECAPQ